MTAWLQPELTTVALCWRLERRDGVALGFTAHDRDLTINGLVYRAAPGMLPSSISLSDGLEIDTLDISGALTSDAICSDDLATGRWDGAKVWLFAADWKNPGDETLPLARGELGEVAVRDGAFTAELAGPTAVLEQPVVEYSSPECRAELGDRRCRVDMVARRRMVPLVEVVDSVTYRCATGGGDHGYGRLRWIDGPNAGLTSAILASDGDRLILREAPPGMVSAGTIVEISEGCDKSLATCAARFANAANFRGEPHLPGNDLLTRYPGA
ncbi:phage conserved hypothetical protein BR0599 [Sphingomonas laterariae]|uniref:Bacteriophage phiJL001 Gp84 C-terminal domain-containing protein n=1 Tax=Edaphosphingomonas laterariae TaxID=861865 RepID=A0A239C971_9SPHN|nr:DUF2163 domain-containing protein [Sphingomonas laterariae]SNS16796.1 phage conserved hypothetical protein BR0599 [Sphingomonas laterariae]